MGWWGPALANVLGGTLLVCIPATPVAVVLHLWLKHRREDYKNHVFKPTPENAYPVYHNEKQGKFDQAHPIAPPQKVPQNLTLTQHNADEVVRLLRDFMRQQQAMMATTVTQEDAPALDAPALPNYVDYDSIRHLIPQGHALVGVTGSGIETKEDYIRALLWIVGGSGSGKTNSTVIRVDDDARRGHQFLGVDPHAIKPDSLTNALRGYACLFRMPIAKKLEDIEAVLDAFLEEFYGRKDEGWPLSPPITLVVDEVGSLTMDVDKGDPVAVRVADKLKRIARICGQESRDFKMFGIYISQNAAGLAWLRRDAVIVLAHQVLQMSERLLVCNQDREIARSMNNWPKGRTYVYGIAFGDGPMLVQQPVVRGRVVDANPVMPDLPMRNARNASRNSDETAIDANADTKVTPLFRASERTEVSSSKKEIVSEETKRIIARLAKDMALRDVARYVGLAGEKYYIFKQVCEELGLKKVEEA